MKADLLGDRAPVLSSQVWHGRFGQMLIETCADGTVWINGEVVSETLPKQSALNADRSADEPDRSSRSAMNSRSTCHMCGRPLGAADDPLSVDCGGDCWGCIGLLEADMGDPASLARVRAEAAQGLRPGWVDHGNGA